MADSAQVEQALINLIAAALYPNGTSQPSIIGSAVEIQRGWATDQQMTNATNAGAALIAIHADKAMARDATKYPRSWQGMPGVATIIATVSGVTITLAGTVSVGHIIAIQCQGVWFYYVVQAGDTLATIATVFAGAIPGVTASGAVLTLPATGDPPQTRVGMQGTSSVEVSRQQQVFRIICWAPTPAIRDAVFAAVPGRLALNGSRLTMPDGSIATWMNQRETGPDDMPARAKMWRRDVVVTYDWPVLVTQSSAPLMLLGIDVAVNALEILQVGDVVYPTQVWTDGLSNPLVDAVGDLLGVV